MKRTVLIALLAVIASAIFAGGGILGANSPVHAATADIEPIATPAVADAVHDGLPHQLPTTYDSPADAFINSIACGVFAGGPAAVLASPAGPWGSFVAGTVAAAGCAAFIEVVVPRTPYPSQGFNEFGGAAAAADPYAGVCQGGSCH